MNVVQIAIVSIGQWRRGGGGASENKIRTDWESEPEENSKLFPSGNRHFIVDVFMKTEYKSLWASTVITLSVS